MRAVLHLFVAVLTMAALTPAPGAAAPSSASAAWETLPGRDVAVLYHADDLPYASRVLAICEERAPGIAASMGLRSISPVRVMVAATDDEFAELTHYGAPDWGVGCALSREGLVVLKSPRIVDYPLQMESVVQHELAHIAAGRVLRGIDVPRWFHEGMAQAIAGEWRVSESTDLSRAAAAGVLPGLSDLDAAFPSDRRAASIAYATSFQAVRFLMERSGARTPGQLVAAIAAARDFDAAVYGLTGWTREQFEEEYGEFLSRRFNIGTLLSDDGVLFAGLTVAFVVIVVVRVSRSRARLREWEKQELAGGTPGTRDSRPPDSRWS